MVFNPLRYIMRMRHISKTFDATPQQNFFNYTDLDLKSLKAVYVYPKRKCWLIIEIEFVLQITINWIVQLVKKYEALLVWVGKQLYFFLHLTDPILLGWLIKKLIFWANYSQITYFFYITFWIWKIVVEIRLNRVIYN